MSDSNTDDGGVQTNSIGDMLDMDVAEAGDSLPFDWDEEPYRVHDGEERSVAFDILWDETGTFPPTIDDDVVHAILDDTDHKYRITIDAEGVEHRESTVGATGIALFAYLDADAVVEVVDA